MIEVNSGNIRTGVTQIVADASFRLDVLVCCAPIFPGRYP